ncbi:MAG: GntR family transcriptional regulator [Muribaculaceae bacterium]|nr:GntR family transcriptional regulator [Muribaculaceae bacterium]MDE6134128.1 GntR family transcriptional regulator [Muribaculaceae bacterium]
MDFKTDRPIYRQITDYAFGCILGGTWRPGEKVPSVRELAVELAVNSHTVLKAYDQLQSREIIVARRGMGFFLAENAPESVMAVLREEFFESTVPALSEQMRRLGISAEELVAALK